MLFAACIRCRVGVFRILNYRSELDAFVGRRFHAARAQPTTSPTATVAANARRHAGRRRWRPRAISSAFEAWRDALDSFLATCSSSKASVRPIVRVRLDAAHNADSNALVSTRTRGSPTALLASARPSAIKSRKPIHCATRRAAKRDGSDRSSLVGRDRLTGSSFITTRLPASRSPSVRTCEVPVASQSHTSVRTFSKRRDP
jgi:hypothetical protein